MVPAILRSWGWEGGVFPTVLRPWLDHHLAKSLLSLNIEAALAGVGTLHNRAAGVGTLDNRTCTTTSRFI